MAERISCPNGLPVPIRVRGDEPCLQCGWGPVPRDAISSNTMYFARRHFCRRAFLICVRFLAVSGMTCCPDTACSGESTSVQRTCKNHLFRSVLGATSPACSADENLFREMPYPSYHAFCPQAFLPAGIFDVPCFRWLPAVSGMTCRPTTVCSRRYRNCPAERNEEGGPSLVPRGTFTGNHGTQRFYRPPFLLLLSAAGLFMLRQHRPRHTPKGEGRACTAAAGTVFPEKTKKDGRYLFLRRPFWLFRKSST